MDPVAAAAAAPPSDIFADFATADNTAHAEITWQEDDADSLGRGYRGRGTECSNQGLCDRAAGACTYVLR